ncbi:MAG: FUN14 domain-containing protein [Thermoproteota archaeon]|nr:FUN14 domain-containing protein [Thermoproteota archaeon]
MSADSVNSIATTIGGGFFGGLLIGYALKKVVKIIAVLVGLFVAGLAYLQYQQLASINWDKFESTITGLANTTTNILSDYNIESLATTNLGVPLTGGMSAGFAIGFMKG